MPARTHRPLRTLLAGAAAALVVSTTSAAAPAAGSPERAGSGVTVLAAARTSAQQEAVTRYWTPERMRSAVPVDGPARRSRDVQARRSGALPQSGPQTTRTVRRGSRSLVPPPLSVGVPWTQGGPVAAITGKVFFVRDGTGYVCSGSSVESANRSTVLTAGHCLTEGGVDATEVVFVPGYAHGSAPHGQWVATELVPTPQWRDGDQLMLETANFDAGFAVVAPREDGARLADVVGAFPIGFDQPAGQRVAVFGYPAAWPYDGQALQHCRGRRFADANPASTDEGVRCAMTGGSSGGPWLSGFDGRTGTVTSLVSFSYDSAPDVLYGPRFGEEVRRTYAAASS